LRVLLLALEERPYEAHLLLSSCKARSARPSINQSSGTRAQFTYTARLSAEVLSFDVHGHTTRFHILRQFIRNIVAKAFLAGKALRVDSGNPSQFGDANQVVGG
jgi:hypothetical protein